MKTALVLSLTVAAALSASAADVSKHNTAVSGGKLPKPVKVALVKVAGGFVDPVRVSLAPGDNDRLFVCERTGVVRLIKNGKVQDKPFLDIHDTVVSSFLEQGLYDLEFHPKYAENGKFYVSYSDMWFNGASFIVEYQVSKTNPDRADQETPRVVFQMARPYANHNGGEIAFGPDGYLYVGSGDGGWEGDVLGAGQDLTTLLAKILRIDVNPSSPDRGYSIPKDNPFITASSQMKLFGVSEEAFNRLHPNARPEIWSYGLRNPWTFQFDPKTGDMFIADIGQNHFEEIDFEPKGKAGVNYGWKFMCGTHPFPLPVDADGKPLLDAVKDAPRVGEMPICEYSHVDQGNCVIGFGVYRGSKYPQMDGTYFFGDWGSGKVWGTARNGQGDWQMEELLNTKLMFTGGGQAPDGTLYVTDAKANYGGPADPARNERGSVWMLVPMDKVPAGAEVAPVE